MDAEFKSALGTVATKAVATRNAFRLRITPLSTGLFQAVYPLL